MRRAIEAALHCARCPIIGTTCRTYARFSHPVSPFWHHRTRSDESPSHGPCISSFQIFYLMKFHKPGDFQI